MPSEASIWSPQVNTIDQALRDILQSTTVETEGAGYVGYNPALAYPPATVGAALNNLDDAMQLLAQELEDQLEGLEIISPADFGAVGDGVADDTTAMTDFLLACVNKLGDLGGANKTYKITAPLVGLSNTYLRGRGAKIDLSALTAGQTGLSFVGSITTSSALAVDATARAYSVQVADGSSFVTGDWVQIHTETSYYPYPGYNVAKGEWVQLRNVVGNTLYFTTPLVDSYLIADGGKVHKSSLRKNIYVSGINFVGSNTPGAGERGLGFRYCQNVLVDDVTLNGIDTYAVEFSSSLLFVIRDSYTKGVFYDGVSGTIFYGVTILEGCQYFNIRGIKGEQHRHLVVTTARSAGQGFYGQPMFGVIEGCIMFDAEAGNNGRSFAYEVHGTGRYLLFVNNQSNGCHSHMRIEGGSDIMVLGQKCRGFASRGIIIGGPLQTVRNVKIANFQTDGPSGELGAVVTPVILIEASAVMENITIDGVSADNLCVAYALNNAIVVNASTVMKNIRIRYPELHAGAVEGTSYAILCAASTKEVSVEMPLISGFRSAANFSGDDCAFVGGEVKNAATAGTGFGVYSNGARTVIAGTLFRNINTPVRLDTSSVNNKVNWINVYGAVATTVSDGGTDNLINGEKMYSVVVDPPSIANNASHSFPIAATGLGFGDTVVGITASIDRAGITADAWVTSSTVITVRYTNNTGGAVDLASHTCNVHLRKRNF